MDEMTLFRCATADPNVFLAGRPLARPPLDLDFQPHTLGQVRIFTRLLDTTNNFSLTGVPVRLD